MITYSNLNFPENGDPMWLSIDLQRIDQWSTIFQLQGMEYQAIEFPEADWLFLGDRFLALDNVTTIERLCDGIHRAKHVVINDLVHNYEEQHAWVEKGLPTWMPKRDYYLVTNTKRRLNPPPWLQVHYYDFLFNRTKAYYSGFPFSGDHWYHAGHQNYSAPCVKDVADHKSKIFLSPCRLYVDQNRTYFREKLFDLMEKFAEDGHRSGPGRVKNGAWDKSRVGLYLASSADDPFLNYRRLGWLYDPINAKVRIKKKALKKWKGARWGGFNPIHSRYYDDTFISIYGETIEHGSSIVITEKTYEPLIKGHFVLPFGSRGLVKAVRALGFKIPDFIDYGYDLVEDDSERFTRYTDEVKRLMRIPIGRWRTLWRQHTGLLRHNQRLFHARDYYQLHLPWNTNVQPATPTIQRPKFFPNASQAAPILSQGPKISTIGFIGLGKLGFPCAETLAEHHEVEGYDVRPIRSNRVRVVNSLVEVCRGKDVVFVAVPTPHESAYGGETPTTHLPPQDFDYSIVRSVLRQLGNVIGPEQLVVLISTVLPGTVRTKLRPSLGIGHLLYNPYLIAMGSVKWDMVHPEMLIIGSEDGTSSTQVRKLINIYRPVMENDPRIEIGTWEEAECIKIFYNTFISAKISLVNMIQDVAERIEHTNVDVVTRALKESHQRITGPAYMTAGMGDGGPCHPRDNIALRWLSQKLELGYDIFGAIIASREGQASNLAARLIELADESGASTIWIHGKAYKPLIENTMGSYSLLVAHYIKMRDRDVQFVDPFTGDARNRIKGVVLLAHSTDVTYRSGPRANGRRLYCEIAPGSVVVDPWRTIDQKDVPGCRIVYFGNGRKHRPGRLQELTEISSSSIHDNVLK
jgi:UDPglucose 6-dehydrogenase